MSGVWHLILSLGMLATLWIVLGAYRSVRETTLITAWIWSFLATITWIIIWFSDQYCAALSPELADHVWYACAVLSLCPPIAVLGARRPGTRVWNWFILLPMLLALGWPVATLWLLGTELRGLQLEAPQLIAYCLVLVMGIGNFCGTRFTLSALIYGCAVLAIVVSSSTACPFWLAERPVVRFWSSFLMVMAIASIRMSRRPISSTPLDRLWVDFFDSFGIVWGRRIQDRVNFAAQKEGLLVRLDLNGFVWKEMKLTEESHGDASVANRRIEHIVRWLLRRFVNEAWIDERLGSTAPNKSTEVNVDS